MCGRTACTLSPDVLCQACSYKKSNSTGYSKVEWKENGKEYRTSSNFTPTFYGPVMVSKKHLDPSAAPNERVMQPMMWGMIPPWHTGTPTKHKLSTNNCRVEGLTESKIFKNPLMKGQRCVVLCDGFYEWKKPEGKGDKQPYLIYLPQPEGISMFEPETWKDRLDEFWSKENGWKGPKPLTMAGLFDVWKSPEDGNLIFSYSVVTMDSCPAFSWIHERMPAVLETEEDIDDWLDFTRVPAQQALTKLKASTILICHPVSTDVNNSRNNGYHLTKRIDLDKPKPLTGSGKFMANWLKKASPVRGGQETGGNKSNNANDTKEGVKRQLPMNDLVQGSSSKKLKEEEESG